MSFNFTPAGKNLLLDSLTGAITVSIHTADPTNAGTTGELSGGTYARQTIGYEASNAGNRNADTLPTIQIPGGNTISHGALWYGGVCIAKGPLAAAEQYTADGEYQLTDADLTLINPA